MGRIYHSVEELVGRTPLLKLTRLGQKLGLEAKILAKLEYFNPAGSVKDRVAKQMMQDAREEGCWPEGTVIVEPTSGNTGIGLASLGAANGYRVILVMPETMSQERRSLMKAYGAELVLTPGEKGMKGAIERANELLGEIPGAVLAGQFENPSNPKAHRTSTGPEIYEDTEGQVDIFVAGVGTGGTITGAGGYLKEKLPNLKVVAAEPKDSPVLSGGQPGAHKIQGIGAGFVPKVLNTSVYDEVMCVDHQEAYAMAALTARTEGILVGVSSGAALWAAVKQAQKPDNEGKTIVVLLPDTGERYLSCGLFDV